MNRTGILALDLFAPVLVIRHSDGVAWFAPLLSPAVHRYAAVHLMQGDKGGL